MQAPKHHPDSASSAVSAVETAPARRLRIAMIIPAFNEEGAIGTVVSGFVPIKRDDGSPVIDEIVVVDNNSKDRTPEVARGAGATVVFEGRPGYGSACLGGLRYLRDHPDGPPDAVVFADGDGSNDPKDLASLVQPILQGEQDMVLGARPARAASGSLTPPQKFGNVLACQLMKWLYGMDYNDLGPFRVITWRALERLDMQDPNYGWTVEMQLKAARYQLRVREVDVANHARIAGKSKISGTLKGVVFAGTKIISTIFRYG